MIGGACDQVAFGGAGRGQDAFELQSRDHVGEFGILVGVKHLGIKRFESGGQNDGTHAEGHVLFLLVVFNGARGTDFFAVPAFTLGQFDALGRIDAVFQGNGLIVFHVDGFAFDQACVVGVRDFFGTFFGAETAGDTLVRVDVPRFFLEQNLKIACLAFDVDDFAQCF